MLFAHLSYLPLIKMLMIDFHKESRVHIKTTLGYQS